MKRGLLLLFLVVGLCQCSSNNRVEYYRNAIPEASTGHTPPEQVAVLAQAPAVYRELGPVSTKSGLTGNWGRILKRLKEQASDMGANAIVVPKIGHYDKAAITEAYLGMPGAYARGPAEDELKPRRSPVHGLAIFVP